LPERILGVSALGHDAAVSLICGDDIVFAGHAERYSRIKNDGNLNAALLADALRDGPPDVVCWYERPWLKKLRQIRAGQWREVRSISPAAHLAAFGLNVPIVYYDHHRTHAAAGYYTSPFSDACVVVIDAIGEFTTISVWQGRDDRLVKLWGQNYPHSLGLLYSAITQRCGYKPNEEEYIVMGMAAFGQPRYVQAIRDDLVRDEGPGFRLRHNVHRGVRWWRPDIDDVENLAASMQAITEDYLVKLLTIAKRWTNSKHLVLMGGVALNCVANSVIATHCGFHDIWIMPNPGDAGSSLGAALAYRGKRIAWGSAYLGHDIARHLDSHGVLSALEEGQTVGVANGRAEFGPRALGNRSLLADPRGAEVKDKVNRIKQREPFRPFAPMILAELAHDYFVLPAAQSPYMQFVAQCRDPDRFPAICHVDGSSRVQTVSRLDNAGLYDLLRGWYDRTGCPMLLNTSLNIKGEPLVNTWEDAQRFAAVHGVMVY